MYVDAILQQKGHEVVSVDPRETVADVAALLSRRAIGAVLLQDSTGAVIGIISERDIVRHIAASGAKCLAMLAPEIMTKGVISCGPRDTIHQIMSVMTERRIRHMPVMAGRRRHLDRRHRQVPDQRDRDGIHGASRLYRHRLTRPANQAT